MKKIILSIYSVLALLSSAIACSDHDDSVPREQTSDEFEPTDETLMD